MYPDYDRERVALMDEQWHFVLQRYAFQAKQLKKLTGQSLSHCYDLLARGHGFSSWPCMRRVLSDLHYVDHWTASGIHDTIPPERLRAYAILLALSGEEMATDEDGCPDGGQLEGVLARVPAVDPRQDEDELFDESFEGVVLMSKWRQVVFDQSLWLGAHPIWSGNLEVIVSDFYWRCSRLFDGDHDFAAECAMAIFGTKELNALDRYGRSQRVLRVLDRQVGKCLAGDSCELTPQLQEAYRCAQTGSCLPLETWRSLLRDAHPLTLDGAVDDGPTVGHLLANGPNNCWATIEINKDPPPADTPYPPPGKDRPKRFFAPYDVYAPTLESAAKCAATAGWPPSISQVETSKAERHGVPHLVGHWHLEWC